MSEEHAVTIGSYRIEQLKAENWMPWKRRMLAIFRDLGLEKYIGIIVLPKFSSVRFSHLFWRTENRTERSGPELNQNWNRTG
jgi:hypothetical protein